MTTPVRQRLTSLERQVRDYSTRAWYTVPPAHHRRGADPNAAREPTGLPTEQRLAARVVDELVGGHPANLGFCDCPPCDCVVDDAKAVVHGYTGPCKHDLACLHTGREEGSAKVSERLLAFAGQRSPALAAALRSEPGVEAAYDLAGLTDSERQVARYKHQGKTSEEIGSLTNRKASTVRVLYGRAMDELRRLARVEEAAA